MKSLLVLRLRILGERKVPGGKGSSAADRYEIGNRDSA